MTTPVETTVMVLRSASTWAKNYDQHVRTVFGDDYDGEAMAAEMAERLENAEATYVQEQREDVALTNQREEIVEDTQRLLSSAIALATIAFTGASNFEDLLSDFSAGPPSNIRSPQTARKALTRLEAAMAIHGDVLDERLANVDAFRQEMEDVIVRFEEVRDGDALETGETKGAYRRRQEARAEAVDLIRNFQLAAEATEWMQPEALEKLHGIFDAHVESRRRTVREDDILENSGDPETPAPSPQPTPAPTPAPADDPEVAE
jgi:hypothetical protein